MIEYEVEGHKMFIDKPMSSRAIMNPLIIKLIGDFVHSGNTVINVGAFMGHMTLLCARRAGVNGHIYAFEPDPTSFEFLQKNVKANGYQNCTLVQKAVGKESGTAQLYRGRDCYSQNTIYKCARRYHEVLSVEMISLDDYFEHFEKSIDFIKIDVEGSEPGVLLGMETLIEKNSQVMVVMEFSPALSHIFNYPPTMPLRFFTSRGFKTYNLDHQAGKIKPIYNEKDLLERYTIQNKKQADLFFMRKK